MQRRKEFKATFLVILVLSSTFTAVLAHRLPVTFHQQRERRSLQRVERQADEFGLGTILQLSLKYAPLLFNTFFGGGGGGGGGASSAAPTQNTDRIEELNLKDDDPFSWPNLLSMGIKIALQLFSSATSDGIDKSDISPTQAVLGTVIGAMTGSEDPSEVALMAKQASEVINLMVTLVEALQTSFSS